MRCKNSILFLYIFICIVFLASCSNSKEKDEESYKVEFEATSMNKSQEQLEIDEARLKYTELSVSDWESYTREHEDKLIIATVFASWCEFCREGAPHLVSTSLKYKNNSKILFVGLNAQDSLLGLSRFVKQYNIDYKVFRVEDKVLDSIRIHALPVTLYYYGDVEIQRDISHRNEDELVESIENILKTFSIE